MESVLCFDYYRSSDLIPFISSAFARYCRLIEVAEGRRHGLKRSSNLLTKPEIHSIKFRRSKLTLALAWRIGHVFGASVSHNLEREFGGKRFFLFESAVTL